MSRTTKTALSLVGAALLAGCGLSAERSIDSLTATPPTGDVFHQTLRLSGLTEDRYVGLLRGDIARGQLVNSF